MNVIEEFIYAMTAIAALSQAPLTPGITVNTDAPVQVFTDHAHKCQYVVAGTSEGLHVIVTGDDHCRDRILIDGRRIAPQRRASDD